MSTKRGLLLPDVVLLAHRCRRKGEYLRACSAFQAAAVIARRGGDYAYETVLLIRAYECHAKVMEQL